MQKNSRNIIYVGARKKKKVGISIFDFNVDTNLLFSREVISSVVEYTERSIKFTF